jgi:formyltetrahydrofolate hydrolase|tara:strand:+ start:298 stop:411 length:114 start_codon:yes stop_codon:yes gene_type:complete
MRVEFDLGKNASFLANAVRMCTEQRFLLNQEKTVVFT